MDAGALSCNPAKATIGVTVLGMPILVLFILSSLTAKWSFTGHDLRPNDSLLNYTTGAVSVLLGLMFSVSVMAVVNFGGGFELTMVSVLFVVIGALCPVALGVCYAHFVMGGASESQTRH